VQYAPAAGATAPKACQRSTRDTSSLNVAATSAKHLDGAARRQEANAVGNAWMLRFDAHVQVQRFTLNLID
jgi:hypothetical protein